MADRRRLPSLNALRAFEAAARHQSLSRGARELSVTHGAISRQVAKLEDHLGAKLFERGHQQVVLTKAGASYAAHLQILFDQIRDVTVAHFETGPKHPSLRIGVLATFGIRLLIPRLARFKEAYPEISIQIESASSPFDPQDPNIDVAIWRGQGGWKDIEAEKLFTERVIAVGSPIMVAQHDVRDVDDIESFPLLHAVKGPISWGDWLQAAGAKKVREDAGVRLEYSWLAYQGAAHGLGLAVAETRFVSDDLMGGRLMQILDTSVGTGESYYAVCTKTKASYSRVKNFIDWLKAECAQVSVQAGV